MEFLFLLQDDLDTVSVGGQTTAGLGYGSSVLHTTSMLESLQAMIKQKDGEISQMQWEITQLQTERRFMSEEVSNLTIQLENVSSDLTY